MSNSYFQNREYSWLQFNQRVLEEADDIDVPLLERFKFLAIFNSNLDEFFMVRVGSLTDFEKIDPTHVDIRGNMTYHQQLKMINKWLKPILQYKDEVFNRLMEDFKKQDIHFLYSKEMSEDRLKIAKRLVKSTIIPLCSPIILDKRHPWPHLLNKSTSIFVSCKKGDKTWYGVCSIPVNCPTIMQLPANGSYYFFTIDILLEQLKFIFKGFELVNYVVFRITRNADLAQDEKDLEDEDFRATIKKQIINRKKQPIVRVEVLKTTEDVLLTELCRRLSIDKNSVFMSDSILDINSVFSLKMINTANYPFYRSKELIRFKDDTYFHTLQKKELLLSYPYESMQPFIDILFCASNDSLVQSISITLYRVASSSQIIEALIRASENNIAVTVLIELRARFDEEHNIEVSKRLEDAGCTIFYGLEDKKVHSKLCVIKRSNNEYITYIGTGNFNEKTSRLYTDLALITCDTSIGKKADQLVKDLLINELGNYEPLLVAPINFKKTMIQYIEQETEKGSNGRIFLKMNSMTDIELMEKLKDASVAGCQVTCLIRGITCLLPSVVPYTENIKIMSLVGRYLEHSRIFIFGDMIYGKTIISSADWMTRNTERRVEVAIEIKDIDNKKKIASIIECCLADNRKIRIVNNQGKMLKPVQQTPVYTCVDALQNMEFPYVVKKESWFQEMKRYFQRMG